MFKRKDIESKIKQANSNLSMNNTALAKTFSLIAIAMMMYNDRVKVK